MMVQAFDYYLLCGGMDMGYHFVCRDGVGDDMPSSSFLCGFNAIPQTN